jgi:hypothetical protein
MTAVDVDDVSVWGQQGVFMKGHLGVSNPDSSGN